MVASSPDHTSDGESMSFSWRSGVGVRVAVTLVLAVLGFTTPAAAQQRDSIPGVTLGLMYETSYSPALAVKPFMESL